jgi:leucyl/phenylalanyl-tRNA---protein transferase
MRRSRVRFLSPAPRHAADLWPFMTVRQPPLPWLEPGEPLPPVEQAWGPADPTPGLLAAGGDLSVRSLVAAYRVGVFPWFSTGQPILWWSPDPRMVLAVDQFRWHRSLRQKLKAWTAAGRLELRFDTAFARVMAACATAPREGQGGTWIVPVMQDAYAALHRAHSVETWLDGELVGGLYAVNVGQAVFGESMFSRVPDASKIALAALVAWCRASGVAQIDCQQHTEHLAFMGAQLVPRRQFVRQVSVAAQQAPPDWTFSSLYWQRLDLSSARKLSSAPPASPA